MMNLEVFKGQSWLQNRWISRVLWFLSSSRNASVLIFSCLAAYLLEINGLNQLTLSGIQRKTSFFLFSFFWVLFILGGTTKQKTGESYVVFCIVEFAIPPFNSSLRYSAIQSFLYF